VALAGCVEPGEPDNRDPVVAILAPEADVVVSEAHDLDLWARVTDADEPNSNLEYRWSSDLAGELFDGPLPVQNETGNEERVWPNPPPGDHVLTLQAWDTADGDAETSVAIKVTPNTAPECSIVSPEPGSRLTLPSDGLMEAVGAVGDLETAASTLDIRWEDADGAVLATPAPAEAGEFTTALEARAGPMTVVLRVTDPLGLECEQRVSFTTNFRPTAPEVALEPDPPSIFEDLVGSVVTASTDPDGPDELIRYRWAWKEYDLWVTGATADTISGDELARDEIWTAYVYAVDIEGAESEPGIASVTVPNSPPTPPVVAIQPNPAPQAVDLACVVVTPGTDPDPEDSLQYEYTWSIAGVAAPWDAGFTPWTETTIGETWECSAKATDGALASESSDPGTVEIVEGCTAGVFGGAGEVTVPDAVPLRLGAGDFAVEAWIKLAAYGPGNAPTAIVSKRGPAQLDGWFLGICGSQEGCAGAPAWKVSGDGDPSISGVDPLSLNEWHHVAVSYDSAFGGQWGSLYVDGIYVAGDFLPQPNITTSSALVIGEDSAGFQSSNHIGIIDDVRVSDANRYPDSENFVPARTLYDDGFTIGLWGFEEGTGAEVHDLSFHGHDGIALGMTWTSDSSCGIDRPPNPPELAITPDEPEEGVALTCEVAAPSSDPEGNPVTYPGRWIKNGSTWTTFSDLPQTLPAADNTGTDEWQCEASGFDGLMASDTDTATVWSGFSNVCVLTVSDPSSTASQICSFNSPVDGQLRMTMDNPDGSQDGVFLVEPGFVPAVPIQTGTQSGGIGGSTVIAYVTHDVEINIPSVALNLAVSYDPAAGTANSGTDTLTIDYVPGPWTETVAVGYIGTATVGPTDASSVFLGNVTIPAGARLMFQAMQCGTGGGAQGIYVDEDGVPGNDFVAAVPTGLPDQCTATDGIWTQSVDPGTYDFSVQQQDTNFLDNGGTRSVDVYWYEP